MSRDRLRKKIPHTAQLKLAEEHIEPILAGRKTASDLMC